MILSSAAKCQHCSTWRTDARVFSIGLPVLLMSVILFCAFYSVEAWTKAVRQQRLFEEELEVRRLSQPATPSPIPR